jgi:predicted AAA+ superfamily ATPase
MPKIYIADTGLICSLLKIKDQKIPLYLKGKLFENFIFQQLLVHTSLMEAELFFWREKQKEIDFIISYNHNIFPIEVKLSKKVNIADAKNIIEFSKKNKIGNGFIIYNGNETIEIGKNIYAIPWYLL